MNLGARGPSTFLDEGDSVGDIQKSLRGTSSKRSVAGLDAFKIYLKWQQTQIVNTLYFNILLPYKYLKCV